MMPFVFQEKLSLHAEGRCVVLPAGLKNKAELLSFLSDAFSFPAYFGHNWDALADCLSDLIWENSPKITLVHQDLPMSGKPREQRIYLQILADVIQQSDRFQVIFPEQNRPEIRQLLAATD